MFQNVVVRCMVKINPQTTHKPPTSIPTVVARTVTFVKQVGKEPVPQRGGKSDDSVFANIGVAQ